MIKTGVFAMAIFMMSPVLGLAQDTPGQALAALTFKQIDADADQSVTLAELQGFGVDVLTSMDADDDVSITMPEFQAWDFGFVDIADEADKMEGYGTAQRMMFDLWDRDNDQKITADEMQAAMAREAAYADLDGNNALSADEFVTGFGMMVALRAALKPV